MAKGKGDAPPFRVPRLMHLMEDDEDVPGFVSPIDEVIEKYKVRASRLVIIDDLIRTYYENMKTGDFKNAIWNLMTAYKLFAGLTTFGSKREIKEVEAKIDDIKDKVDKKKPITAFDALELFEKVMTFLNKHFSYMASKEYGLLTEERAAMMLQKDIYDEDIEELEKVKEEFRKEKESEKEVESQYVDYEEDDSDLASDSDYEV